MELRRAHVSSHRDHTAPEGCDKILIRRVRVIRSIRNDVTCIKMMNLLKEALPEIQRNKHTTLNCSKNTEDLASIAIRKQTEQTALELYDKTILFPRTALIQHSQIN